MRCLFVCLGMIAASAAMGDTLTVPGNPSVIASQVEEGLNFDLPVGVWDGSVPTQTIAGTTQHQVLHLPRDAGARRVVDDLTAQLRSQGYVIRLMCEDKDCGGFDFRFDLQLIPPPDMFVDIGHYKYVSAIHPDGRSVAVLASRTQDRVHLHLTYVTPDGAELPELEGTTFIPENTGPVDLATALETVGRAVLADLRFQLGSSELDGDSFASLQELADYLSTNPQRTIALVGHTDATGSLDGNIALSQKRAGSVRTLLLDRYGINSGRVGAQGVGYLAPAAANTTDAGRALNRRVEVILTSTE